MNLKKDAYHLVRKLLSQSMRQKVKGRMWQMRAKFAPLLKARYGTYTNTELRTELQRHMPADFEILMVHSSISDMLPMYQNNARELLNLLIEMVGPNRTLAMPAFFFGKPELYNRDYFRKNPRFDVRRTPSQMGMVTELFRRTPKVVRSLHPTHSVCALGPLADEIVATHHLSPWPCGELSPFGVMGKRDTVILGLGTEYFRALTQVHAKEEALADKFPVPREAEEPVKLDLVDSTGKAIPYEMSLPISHQYGLRLERLIDLGGAGVVKAWSFKGTSFYVTTASKIDAAVLNGALRGQTLYVPN